MKRIGKFSSVLIRPHRKEEEPIGNLVLITYIGRRKNNEECREANDIEWYIRRWSHKLLKWVNPNLKLRIGQIIQRI